MVPRTWKELRHRGIYLRKNVLEESLGSTSWRLAIYPAKEQSPFLAKSQTHLLVGSNLRCKPFSFKLCLSNTKRIGKGHMSQQQNTVLVEHISTKHGAVVGHLE